MREYLTKTTEPKTVHGEWGIYHRYTYGVAGERFFRELADRGRLVASTCPKCKHAFLPPNMYCEDCFVEMTEHRPVEGHGTVDSFTVLHESIEETKLPEPVVVAFVRFDGIAGGLLGAVRGIAPGSVKVGLKVKPVIETAKPTHSPRDVSFIPA